MNESLKIAVCGDVHAEYGAFNRFIGKLDADIILQVGDLGYWPRWTPKMWWPQRHRPKAIPTIKSPKTKIYFCDGNHEDHATLQALPKPEIFPNVFYMKRGSIMTLPDGRNILFMGGANSYDKEDRTCGIDWFPQENITYEELERIPKDTRIDIVISHTCPQHFDIEHMLKRKTIQYGRVADSNREILSHILKEFRPKLWYFGHWHVYATGFTMECRWIALDRIMGGNPWWKILDKA